MENAETNNILSKRISLLRAQAGESQQDMADSIGVKRETVKFWESGERQIKGADIVKIARHFNVSADYLLGMSDVKAANADLQAVCKYTGLDEDTVEKLHKLPVIGRVLGDIIPEHGIIFTTYFEEIGKAVLNARLKHEKLSPRFEIEKDAVVTYLGEYNDMIQNIELALFRFSELCRTLPDVYDASKTIKELNAFIWAAFNEDKDYGEYSED